ncbi:MAG: DNA repair protein RecN [Flavobacteriales bacterium]|jgi:DNA repair protein RecN (Recombination protein N)|nr:DNA repair protein RecN [Flavobacteriales bacterium]
MLRRLHIRNFLLIDEAEIELRPGFTVVTGETGSGKSILLGALALVMGERAEAGALHDPARRCVIELEMDATPLRPWFDRHELPWEEPTILRRQLEPGGRSRAFINDTPVRLEQLRDLTARCVHIHGQHHALLLNDPGFHLGAIDRAAGQEADVQAYRTVFRQWRTVRAEHDKLMADQVRTARELDFMRFQLEELDAAALRAGEEADLAQALERAAHADEIRAALMAVEQGMQDDDGVLTAMARIVGGLERAARHDDQVRALVDRLRPVRIELKDIAAEAASLAGTVDQDPAGAERLRERLDLLNALMQKHRVPGTAELIGLRDDLRARTAEAGGLDDRIGELAREAERLGTEVQVHARRLSKQRHAHAGAMAGAVERTLHELGMPDADFQLRLHATAEPGPDGMDSVQALFTANRDRAPSPLEKTASGGELSRVMLALIAQAADASGLGTVIFDEVDTGVSGAVAERMGALMDRMGHGRQVIAITHLPQVAAQAGAHLEVTKAVAGERTITRIAPLHAEERVAAIARMLSGRRMSKVAMENARALMGRK